MKIFKDKVDIAITTVDLSEAIGVWLAGKTYAATGEFTITNIRHCRSDSTYALRFNVEEKS